MIEALKNFSFITDLIGSLKVLFRIIGGGIGNFVDFVINLPSFFYHLVDFIPMPFQGLVIVFLSLIILVIIMKVVVHFV